MSAVITSSIAAKPPITSASREDLESGDIVTLVAVDPATTYLWAIVFKPEDVSGVPSAATLSSLVGPGPITFTVDNEGPYLIRLVVDLGLPTEDTQYVRLRYCTEYNSLRLVAARESVTPTISIPVDATSSGWTTDQNFNLLKLNTEMERIDNLISMNPITGVNSSPYVVLTTDHVLGVNTGTAKTIVLPNHAVTAIPNGRTITIKDITGTASTNNITISTTLSGTIDGLSDYVIRSNWSSVTLVANGLLGASQVWYII